MFQISTKLKALMAAGALGAALACAAPAGAVTLLSAAMDTSNTAWINGPAVNVYAYIGPVTFTTDGTPDTLTAYCVDIFHDMFLGSLNGGAGYAYHDEALATDSSASTPAGQAGVALSQSQLNRISSLLNFSNVLIDTNAVDLSHKLAGIQGAIWEIENPLYTVTASGAVQPYISQYAAAAAVTLPVGVFHSIYADDYGHQAFAYGGGVPEPATWMIMILGFGAMGAALRRRRLAYARA